jgi:hypothetical protein
MTYPTTTSKSIKLTTFIVTTILIAVCFGIWQQVEMPITLNICLIILILIVLMLSWAFAPTSYTIGDYDLRINRNFGSRSIRLSRIKTVYVLTDENKLGIYRIWGVGMFFGNYGKYKSSILGSFQLYATNSKNLVCIILDNESKVVISPDSLDLVADLQNEIS